MKYDTGTVSMTNGSAAVVGTGTAWATNVTAGQLFTLIGSGVTYQVGSVTDDTHLTLSSNWVGTTAAGLTYTIIQSFTPNKQIPYPEIGDVQTATIMKRALTIIDALLVGVGGTPGSLNIAGATSGIVTLAVQAAAGTYNFNLPITAGSTGQVLTSAGGGSSPMTWTAVTGSGSVVLGTAPTFTTRITMTPVAVSTLGTATTGRRAMVNDATATTFASIVTGGGGNTVPVYADGTNWRIG